MADRNATAIAADYTTCVDCSVQLDEVLQEEFAAIAQAQTWVLCGSCYNDRKVLVAARAAMREDRSYGNRILAVFGIPCAYCGELFTRNEMVRCHAGCESLYCPTHAVKYSGTAVQA